MSESISKSTGNDVLDDDAEILNKLGDNGAAYALAVVEEVTGKKIEEIMKVPAGENRLRAFLNSLAALL